MSLLYFGAGFAVADLAGVYLLRENWLLPAGLVCLAVWLWLRLSKRLSVPRRVLLGAGVALLWLFVYGAVFHAPAEAMENRTIRMESVVTDWPEETAYGVRIPVRAGEEGGRKVKALFYGEKELETLRPGDEIASIVYCTPADRVRGEESLYYTSRGILLQMQAYGEVTVTRMDGFSPRYALTRLAGEIRGLIDRLYPPEQAGLLHALLTGDKSGLEAGLRSQLNRVGLGHVVVISGLHVSYLLGFLSLFLKKEKKRSLFILLPVLVAFTIMTGSAPGTVRAVILAGIVMAGQCLGREAHPMVSLSAGLLVLLAANPYAIANAGLQFSFLATAGIFLLGAPWGEAWSKALPKRLRRWFRPLVRLGAVSVGAMVLTVPLSALYFGRFSLIAPVSNLLTGWAVSLAFLGGMLSLGAGALWLPAGKLVAGAVGLPIRFFLWYAGKASRLALAAVTTDAGYYALWAVFVYLVLCLYLFLPVRVKRPVVPLCACVVTLCLSALLTAQTLHRADLTVTVLDVGQGQSVLLSSEGVNALVDCGGTNSPGDTAATYLQAMGVGELDLLVLTHFHADHAGGVPELMDRVKIKTLALPDVEPDNALRLEIEEKAAKQGSTIYYVNENSKAELGKGVLTLFPPLKDSKETNEQCLTLLCSLGEWDALITGDMPAREEKQLVAREPLPDAELLVVGHHGSKSSTCEELLRAVQPENAVISVGYNTYGHPAEETLQRLEAVNAAIYRTDQMGTVTIYANWKEAE